MVVPFEKTSLSLFVCVFSIASSFASARLWIMISCADLIIAFCISTSHLNHLHLHRLLKFISFQGEILIWFCLKNAINKICFGFAFIPSNKVVLMCLTIRFQQILHLKSTLFPSFRCFKLQAKPNHWMQPIHKASITSLLSVVQWWWWCLGCQMGRKSISVASITAKWGECHKLGHYSLVWCSSCLLYHVTMCRRADNHLSLSSHFACFCCQLWHHTVYAHIHVGHFGWCNAYNRRKRLPWRLKVPGIP